MDQIYACFEAKIAKCVAKSQTSNCDQIQMIDNRRQYLDKFKRNIESGRVPESVVSELLPIRNEFIKHSSRSKAIQDVYHVLLKRSMHNNAKIVITALMLVLNKFLNFRDYRAYDDCLDRMMNRNLDVNRSADFFYRKPYEYPKVGDIVLIDSDNREPYLVEVAYAGLFTMQVYESIAIDE